MNSRDNHNVSLTLFEASGLYEDALQTFWDSMSPGAELILSGGGTCTILSPGVRNRGKGPDFRDAVIRIGSSERRGDVELHRKTSDWILHGHNNDPAYGNVILHAVDMDDTTPGNVAFLPDVPLVCLPDPELCQPDGERTSCAAWAAAQSPENVQAFLRDAGLERMREKADGLLADMIRRGTERAFRSKLMDLIGVPGAREAFRTLEQRISAYPDDVFHAHPEAILWGESGLLPDPATHDLTPDALQRVRNLWNEFWQLRMTAEQDAPVFPRNSRPQNSPERRIAMIAAFLSGIAPDPCGKLARLRQQAHAQNDFPGRMLTPFTCNDPFWECHSSFTSSAWKSTCALFGESRAYVLLTDLVIPALHAYLRLTDRNAEIAALEQDYLLLPENPSNKILKIMQDYCFHKKNIRIRSAAEQQGLIHLYRTFCAPMAFQCVKCPVRKSLEVTL